MQLVAWELVPRLLEAFSALTEENVTETTIIGGMSQKLDRHTAAEFSFFLAVPTLLAASVKSFYDVWKHNPEVLAKSNLETLLIGSVAAFFVALLAVRFFIGYLQRHGFKLFGYYRILVGTLVLVLVLLGVIHS